MVTQQSQKFIIIFTLILAIVGIAIGGAGSLFGNEVGNSIGSFFEQEAEKIESALDLHFLGLSESVPEMNGELALLRESQFTLTMTASVGVAVGGAAEFKVYPSLALNWVIDPNSAVD
jgi:hypothetical protein